MWLNVLADAKGMNVAEVEQVLKDPKTANALLGNGKAAAEFVKTYREFITLPSANAAFRQLFLAMSKKKSCRLCTIAPRAKTAPAGPRPHC